MNDINDCYKAFDAVICLTEAHAKGLKFWDGYLGENMRMAANGIRVRDFPELTPEQDIQRDQHKVVWGSSPDRGLECLLGLWPQVRAAVPDATLDIYYDWGMLEKKNPEAAGTLKAEIQNQAGLGVKLVGGVSHDKLHEAYRKASVYAYAQHFYEIYMISAIKAQACGCTVLANDYGSLREVVHDPRTQLMPRDQSNEQTIQEPAGQAAYAKRLIELLTDPPGFRWRKVMSDWARTGFGWERAAAKFKEILA